MKLKTALFTFLIILAPGMFAPIHAEPEWPLYPGLVVRNYTDAVVAPGEAFSGEIPLDNRSDEKREAEVRLQLLDLWEQPVGPAHVQLFSLAVGEKSFVPFSFTVDRTGIYKIEVTVTGREGTSRLRDVTSFAVLPAEPVTDHPFFGTHTVATGELPRLARLLGFKKNRVHNMTQFTWWTRMQPDPGDFLPESHTNRDYERLLDHGFEIYGQWYGTPWWSTDDKNAERPTSPNAYPFRWVPRFDDHLRAYVRETLTRFPEIKEWEIWNEPWVTSHFWAGTAAQYAELCRIIHEESKAMRPDIITYAMLRADSPWVNVALEAGVLNHTDHLAFHGLRLRDDDHPRYARAYVRRLKEQIAPYRTVPLAFTEPKLVTTTFLRGLDFENLSDEARQRTVRGELGARASVQYRVGMLAEGVLTAYTYQHNPAPIHPRIDLTRNFHTTEWTRTPKPELISAGMLIRMLDGGTFRQELRLAAGIPAFLFDRNDGGSMAVVWGEDGARLSLQTDLPAFDIMGGELATSDGLLIDEQIRYFRHTGSVAELAARLNGADRTVLEKPNQQFDESVPADPMWLDEL